MRKRKSDYIVERAVHGENFQNQVVGLITGQYGVSIDEAEIAFEKCLRCDYAVILPISREHPKGVMMSTDVYRQRVAIG